MANLGASEMVSRNEREGRYAGHALRHAVRFAGHRGAPDARRAFIARVAKVLERYERARERTWKRIHAHALARIAEIDEWDGTK